MCSLIYDEDKDDADDRDGGVVWAGADNTILVFAMSSLLSFFAIYTYRTLGEPWMDAVDVKDRAAAAAPFYPIPAEMVDVIMVYDIDVSVLMIILPSRTKIDCITYGEVNYESLLFFS